MDRLPKALGRVLAGCGTGAGLSSFGLATWTGVEYAGLGPEHMPWHAHPENAHQHSIQSHGHPYAVDTSSQSSWNSSGSGAFPTGSGGTVTGAYTGWPDAATDGKVIGGSGVQWTDAGGGGTTGGAGGGQPHLNIQPTSYVNFMLKL